MIDVLLDQWEANRKHAARTEECIEIVNMRLPLLSSEPIRANVAEYWNPSRINFQPQVTLFFPYDKTSIRAIESAFGEAGWKLLNSEMLATYADFISTWLSSDEQVVARLWFESNAPGATCKRIEIGMKEIHYTQRLYEVVCPDQGGQS